MHAVFAADPFILGKSIGRRLVEKGYRRICNLPSVTQYGAEFCRALGEVTLGPKEEYTNLGRFADEGLTVSATVASKESLQQLGNLHPEFILVAPSLDLWNGRAIRWDDLLQRCADVSATVQGEIPILLLATRGAISSAKAREAGSDGVLVL
jgi:predicted TIM-barrel enzyme